MLRVRVLLTVCLCVVCRMSVCEFNFPVLQRHTTAVINVSEEEIVSAMRLVRGPEQCNVICIFCCIIMWPQYITCMLVY